MPLIDSITEYGTDVVIDINGRITSGSALPPACFESSVVTPVFAADQTWACSDLWNLRFRGWTHKETWFDFPDINGYGRIDRVKQGHDDTISGDAGYTDARFRVQHNTGTGFTPTEVWPVSGTA